MKANLLKKYSELPPPPCDSCALYDHCKIQREACGEFVHYARQANPDTPVVEKENRNRIPSEKWYNDLFTDFVGHRPHRQGL